MTLASALAEHIRLQIENGKEVLAAAGNEHYADVFGNPAEVLSVVGNVADVAHTNHLWLMDMIAAGVVRGELGAELQRDRPGNLPEALAFLAARETDSPAQALAHLERVNEKIASSVEKLTDADLDRAVVTVFYGQCTLRDLLFAVIEHGAVHVGQAWGILKGKGVVK